MNANIKKLITLSDNDPEFPNQFVVRVFDFETDKIIVWNWSTLEIALASIKDTWPGEKVYQDISMNKKSKAISIDKLCGEKEGSFSEFIQAQASAAIRERQEDVKRIIKYRKMKSKFKVGDIYEDCAYHPVLCTKVNGDNIEGISLIDGSFPRSCSIKHCAPKKISLRTAKKIKDFGPSQDKKDKVKYLNSKEGGDWNFVIWWDL